MKILEVPWFIISNKIPINHMIREMSDAATTLLFQFHLMTSPSTFCFNHGLSSSLCYSSLLFPPICSFFMKFPPHLTVSSWDPHTSQPFPPPHAVPACSFFHFNPFTLLPSFSSSSLCFFFFLPLCLSRLFFLPFLLRPLFLLSCLILHKLFLYTPLY